jgi:hypothetical protein
MFNKTKSVCIFKQFLAWIWPTAVFIDAIKHVKGFVCFKQFLAWIWSIAVKIYCNSKQYRHVVVSTVLYTCIQSIFSKRDIFSECAGTVKYVLELRNVCMQIPLVPYINYLCKWMSSLLFLSAFCVYFVSVCTLVVLCCFVMCVIVRVL